MLKAVTFDFWNTLYVDLRGAERETRRTELLRTKLAPLGITPSLAALNDALQSGFNFFDTVWLNEHRTPHTGEIVDAILASLRAPVAGEHREQLVAAFEMLLLEVPPEPMPGAVYTLPALAERYRLAVICDTGYSPGRVLRQQLQHDGLLSYFGYLYFSNEHGISKPDPRVFSHTLGELGVRAGEAAHVGDIQRTDIAGAQAAGMSAVHFVGANNSDAGRSTGDLLVRHFEDLPAALGGLTCAGC
jgi:putative hydrolase of the HAD superfamily